MESVAGLALVLAAALILGVRSLLLAVKVVSDGPIYHLYFAVRWWKAGRFFWWPHRSDENAASYFPANGDLWFTWLLASWGGDRLAGLVRHRFWSWRPSLPTAVRASLLGFAPGQPDRDLLVCFVDAALALFLRAQRRHDLHRRVHDRGVLLSAGVPRGSRDGCGVSGGFGGGTGAGHQVCGSRFCSATSRARGRGDRLRAVGRSNQDRSNPALLLLPLCTGGYWYVRNAMLTGNPLYPLEVRLLGRVVAQGLVWAGAMQLSPFYIPLADWRALGDTLFAVLDPRLVPFWLVSLAGAGVIKNPKLKGARAGFSPSR